MQKSIIIDNLQEILSEIETNDVLFFPIQKALHITEEELIHILNSEITDINEA